MVFMEQVEGQHSPDNWQVGDVVTLNNRVFGVLDINHEHDFWTILDLRTGKKSVVFYVDETEESC